MKQLVCEMCGGTDLVKDGGVFVCQSCGCRYSVEEAKKMMVEGVVEVQGTVKVDNSSLIENYLELALSAEKNGNEDEAEGYANKILEIDSDNSTAFLIKGRAAGWQSSRSNVRIEEMIGCFRKALAASQSEEQLAATKKSVAKGAGSISLATMGLFCDNFAKTCSDRCAEELKDAMKWIIPDTIALLEECGGPNVAAAFRSAMATKVNNSAVDASNLSDNRYYEGGKPLQKPGSTTYGFLRDDRKRYAHPDHADFNSFVSCQSTCLELIERAIQLVPEASSQNITRYNNLLSIAPKVIDAYSIELIPGDQYSNPRWAVEYALTDKAKKLRRVDILKWEREKKEVEERFAKEKVERYWAEHRSERDALTSERKDIQEKIDEIKQDTEYADLQSKILDVSLRIDDLNDELRSMGLFQLKERSNKKKEIEDASKEKDGLEEKISTQVGELKKLHDRIREIESLLEHPKMED